MLQLRLVTSDHSPHQRIGKFTANSCTNLGDLLYGVQAIKPCHQGVMKSFRDRQGRHRPVELIAIRLLNQGSRLENSLGELLHKQRISIGFRYDLFLHLGGERAAMRHLGDYAFDVLAAEPTEYQATDIW